MPYIDPTDSLHDHSLLSVLPDLREKYFFWGGGEQCVKA